jgi:hypothetical protein
MSWNNTNEIFLEDALKISYFPTIKEAAKLHYTNLYRKQGDVEPTNVELVLEHIPKIVS